MRTGVVALCSALLGAAGGLALAADLAAAAALPLSLAHAAIAVLLRWQLVSMRAMWALLRGHSVHGRPLAWRRCAAFMSEPQPSFSRV